MAPRAASAATTPVVYASGTPGWGNHSVRPARILIGLGGAPWARIGVTLSVVRTNGVRYCSRMTWYTPGYRLPGDHTSTAVLHYSATGGTGPYWH